MLELQCTSLRKDSQMYKKRIEAVLKQMEEVASERDQVIKHPFLLELLLISALLLEAGRYCNPECTGVTCHDRLFLTPGTPDPRTVLCAVLQEPGREGHVSQADPGAGGAL